MSHQVNILDFTYDIFFRIILATLLMMTTGPYAICFPDASHFPRCPRDSLFPPFRWCLFNFFSLSRIWGDSRIHHSKKIAKIARKGIFARKNADVSFACNLSQAYHILSLHRTSAFIVFFIHVITGSLGNWAATIACFISQMIKKSIIILLCVPFARVFAQFLNLAMVEASSCTARCVIIAAVWLRLFASAASITFAAMCSNHMQLSICVAAVFALWAAFIANTASLAFTADRVVIRILQIAAFNNWW